MNDKFQELLISVLEGYQNIGDANTVIESICKSAGVSEEAFAKIQEVNKLLESFAQKAESLEQAKAQGASRREWLEEQYDAITEGRSDEEKILLMNGISKANEINTSTQE